MYLQMAIYAVRPPVLQRYHLLPQNASDRCKIASERGGKLPALAENHTMLARTVQQFEVCADGSTLVVKLLCEPLNPGPSISARPASVIARGEGILQEEEEEEEDWWVYEGTMRR